MVCVTVGKMGEIVRQKGFEIILFQLINKLWNIFITRES